ncbi:hypothetical protein [Sebaldella sp. S0638]|uniref:hypothetical protein n=1 Tax=Sebaldella sp. S0638 TaxID=2957809 RepID=UPI0020A1EAA3|nr:hypothetical protein [Sebaldella sp. S0638]MCP1226150.1 hypothetical protein [Sebaldella sp. S0638]
MIKEFLLKLQKRKKKKSLIGFGAKKCELNRSEVPVVMLDFPYKISEVALEVLRQGNKKLYIQHLKREGVLKIKKKLDRVLNDIEISRANEVLNNIYLEENEGKLYFVTYIELCEMRGFDHIKNSIEVFKRKAGIVQGIIWS